jgi:hypothetical protein
VRFLDYRFTLTANGTVRTEIVAGVTTFLTMAYIILCSRRCQLFLCVLGRPWHASAAADSARRRGHCRFVFVLTAGIVRERLITAIPRPSTSATPR